MVSKTPPQVAAELDEIDYTLYFATRDGTERRITSGSNLGPPYPNPHYPGGWPDDRWLRVTKDYNDRAALAFEKWPAEYIPVEPGDVLEPSVY